MISKDELIKYIAQSCGISIETSDYFFEVFVNRIGNKLKPGELLHFQDYGYFHKRNCRIQVEKTSDSPFPKSYLVQLVLFSSEMKIRPDLADIHFLKIPNLKSLWADDKEFNKSLNAGDFSPYTDRNQLIKSFATKAEIIVSGWRKDFDHELVEELTIPLTFDLNFLVKSGQKTSTSERIPKSKTKSEQKSPDKDKSEINNESKVAEEDAAINEKVTKKDSSKTELPWNYGNKFLETEKSQSKRSVGDADNNQEVDNHQSFTDDVSDLRKEQVNRLKDFQPVSSHRELSKSEITIQGEIETVRFNQSKSLSDDPEKTSGSKEFTEVKSRSESYRKSGKQKNSKYDKYPGIYSNEKPFKHRRSFLPIVAILSFLIIISIVVYIYFIKGNGVSKSEVTILTNVTPPADLKVVDRDYEYIVSYPYPKMENRIELSGFSNNIFSEANVETKNVDKPEQEIKTKSTTEETVKLKETPNDESKNETKVVETQKPETEDNKVETNNIFFNNGFYVVHISNYETEEAADKTAEKYFDLGYNAIVEVSENRNGEQIYKLYVGDFTSEDFAREFIAKYIN